MRVIRITNRKNEVPRQCAKAIYFCSTFGEKHWHRIASTTILPGLDIWAPRCRKSTPKFSGSCANMDGLETRDVRRVIPRTCFSIEPGIYLPEFGVRSEVNVYVEVGNAEVTGAVQTEMLALLE